MSDTPLDSEFEDGPKITGFHTHTTNSFAGFNPTAMHDLEVILRGLYNKYKVDELRSALAELLMHLYRDPEAHGINFSQMQSDIIEQMYVIYRKLDFTGTKQDMLLAMGNNIDVATIPDMVDGISDTKAVNVVGWKYLFDNHNGSLLAHNGKFGRIKPDATFNHEPIVSFYRLFPTTYDAYLADGYPVDAWCLSSGTLVLEFQYNWSIPAANMNNTIPYYTLSNSTNVLEVAIDAAPGKMRITRIRSGMKVAEEFHQLALWPAGSGKLVISYTAEGTISELDIGMPTTSSTLKMDFVPEKLYLHAPLRGTPGLISRTKAFTYYNRAAADKERVFLLN